MTDSTSDMSPEDGRTYGVEVVPLWVVVEGKRLRDGLDMTRDDLYAHLATDAELPRTEPGEEELFAQAFERHASAGREVVITLVSSKLSKSYENAVAAAKRFGRSVRVVDSASFSGGEFLQALVAAEMARAGCRAWEIVERLEFVKRSQTGYFVTPDLTYVGRSGRLHQTIVALGNVLNVKPVLEVRGGTVELAAQTFSYERARDLLVDLATRNLAYPERMHFLVGHARAPEAGASLLAAVRGGLHRPPRGIMEYECGLAVAIHGGPGALAVFSISDPS